MKKFLALAIFVLVSHPARAGIFDLMIYGPPDRYGQAFAQCAASTVTAAQELACARNYVAANPAPAVGAAEVTAFFERGRVLVEAVRRGRMSDAEARAELAENMADAQARVQAEVRNRIRARRPFSGFRAPRMTTCNFVGQSMYCNQY